MVGHKKQSKDKSKSFSSEKTRKASSKNQSRVPSHRRHKFEDKVRKSKSGNSSKSSKKSSRDVKTPPNPRKHLHELDLEHFTSSAKVLQQAGLSTSNPKVDDKIEYQPHHEILLLGEGDFSFSKALSMALLPLSPELNLTCTSFDDYKTLSEKYPHGPQICSDLRSIPGVRVMHRVDATNFASEEKRLNCDKFDFILFNFPHLGGSKEEDVLENQKLISAFLTQCSLALKDEKSRVHIALRQTEFYDSWDLRRLIEESEGLRLVSVDAFQAETFALRGYVPARTNPAIRSAPDVSNAVVYKIGLKKGKGGEEKREEEREEEKREKGEKEFFDANEMSMRELMGLD